MGSSYRPNGAPSVCFIELKTKFAVRLPQSCPCTHYQCPEWRTFLLTSHSSPTSCCQLVPPVSNFLSIFHHRFDELCPRGCVVPQSIRSRVGDHRSKIFTYFDVRCATCGIGTRLNCALWHGCSSRACARARCFEGNSWAIHVRAICSAIHGTQHSKATGCDGECTRSHCRKRQRIG